MGQWGIKMEDLKWKENRDYHPMDYSFSQAGKKNGYHGPENCNLISN